jgi:hypothetical protein
VTRYRLPHASQTDPPSSGSAKIQEPCSELILVQRHHAFTTGFNGRKVTGSAWQQVIKIKPGCYEFCLQETFITRTRL